MKIWCNTPSNRSQLSKLLMPEGPQCQWGANTGRSLTETTHCATFLQPLKCHPLNPFDHWCSKYVFKGPLSQTEQTFLLFPNWCPSDPSMWKTKQSQFPPFPIVSPPMVRVSTMSCHLRNLVTLSHTDWAMLYWTITHAITGNILRPPGSKCVSC